MSDVEGIRGIRGDIKLGNSFWRERVNSLDNMEDWLRWLPIELLVHSFHGKPVGAANGFL